MTDTETIIAICALAGAIGLFLAALGIVRRRDRMTLLGIAMMAFGATVLLCL